MDDNTSNVTQTNKTQLYDCITGFIDSYKPGNYHIEILGYYDFTKNLHFKTKFTIGEDIYDNHCFSDLHSNHLISFREMQKHLDTIVLELHGVINEEINISTYFSSASDDGNYFGIIVRKEDESAFTVNQERTQNDKKSIWDNLCIQFLLITATLNVMILPSLLVVKFL